MVKAKIYMGSNALESDKKGERKSPYSGETVSSYPLCGADDARAALKIAEQAFEDTRKAPLSQRIAWLRDVAKRLREQKEMFARTITDEIGKPIMFSRIEGGCPDTFSG